MDAPTIIGMLMGGLIAVIAAPLFGKLVEKQWGVKNKSALAVSKLSAFGIVFLFLGLYLFPSALVAMGVGVAAPAPVTGPVQQVIYLQNKGYVVASVRDAYRVPTTYLSSATVYVSESAPVTNAAWQFISTDNTAATGSVTLTVYGKTTGIVYVTVGKSEYYSDYVTTSLAGADTLPSQSLYANVALTKIGGLSITQYDNSNASLSGTTITVDNDATSAYITLDIVENTVYAGIKDLNMLAIRGTYWTTNAVTLSPVIISDADLTLTATGDPTLTNSVTGGWSTAGSMEYGKTLRIKFVISKTASVASQELFRISIDDLSGLTGYLNETGIAETTLSFTT